MLLLNMLLVGPLIVMGLVILYVLCQTLRERMEG
jgi:hypothetical protein